MQFKRQNILVNKEKCSVCYNTPIRLCGVYIGRSTRFLAIHLHTHPYEVYESMNA